MNAAHASNDRNLRKGKVISVVIATAARVVDASALAAVLFNEPEGAAIAGSVLGQAMIAPTLLTYELANVCLTKVRRQPDMRDVFMAAIGFERLMRLQLVEVNPADAAKHQGIIANPNCTTIIMLTALAPLHREVPIKRIVAATYQAASGAGHAAMEELEQSTRAYLDGKPYTPKVLPQPYAFNLFPHNSPWKDELGYCEEELKMLNETRKMLGDDQIRVTATCVRVPVLRTHAEALNVEFSGEMSVARAYALLAKAPGVTVLEDRAKNRWPMPIDVAGKDDVYVGRIRADHSQPRTLDFWVVGDQLLKGAALNAVQCAELVLR